MGTPQYSTPSLDVLQLNLGIAVGSLPSLIEEVSALVQERSDLLDKLREAETEMRVQKEVVERLQEMIRTYESASHTDEGDLAAYAARLSSELHRRLAHPDYEYTTTEGQRKSVWNDVPPTEPDEIPWERNVDYHQGFERFEWHEESYWRRLKPVPEPEPDFDDEGFPDDHSEIY